MVHHAYKTKRKLDHIVVVHFVDDKGIPLFVEKLPPRNAYTTKTGGKKEFVIVTKDNKDYRVYVELGEFLGLGTCYRGVARYSKGQPKDNIKFKTSVAIDKLQHEHILAIQKADKITYAEALRQVIEWGLEAAEKDYDFD